MSTIPQKKGVVLVGVLAVMLLMASAMALLAHSAVGMHETRKRAQLQQTAHLLVESGEAYIRSHKSEWAETPPTEPMTPDVTALLKPPLSGEVTIAIEQADTGHTYRIRARVMLNKMGASETRELKLD